jgi:hypothetical protein
MTSCRGGEVHTTGVMSTPRRIQRKSARFRKRPLQLRDTG